MRRFASLIIVLALAGCTIGGDTRKAIEDGISQNAGHMRDQGLPQEAREIATDNHDLLYGVLYREGVIDELPAEVRERKAKRDAARGGGQ